MKKALITGITGQDGSYLTELLLKKGYQVHGVVRRSSRRWKGWLDGLSLSDIHRQSLSIHFMDLGDLPSIRRLLEEIQPTEIYHLAGQSQVSLSFEMPEVTAYDSGILVLNLLEIVRGLNRSIRLFHAASAEVFGTPEEVPQRESTPFRPVSPYGAAKAFAANIVRIYRDVYGMYLVNGLLYNHESPRRGEDFVTKKICRSAALIAVGKQAELMMGDIDVSRDWGHAKDYVNGMWLSLQHEKPGDYIFSSGFSHSLKEVLDIAFSRVNLQWRDFYILDEGLLRPAESRSLIGDSSKAREILKWHPEYSFESMIAEIMDHEIDKANKLVKL